MHLFKAFQNWAGCALALVIFANPAWAAERLQISGAVLGVWQGFRQGESAPGTSSQLFNLRADVGVQSRLSDTSQIYIQLRAGRGLGLQPAAETFTGAVNSTDFELDKNARGAGVSPLLLAQAWYEFEAGGYQWVVGKLDPFLFFDTNEYADDESREFVNNVFVHNALLDSGSDAGVDAYGFSPGVVVSSKTDPAHASSPVIRLGLFGHGHGQNFSGSLNQPFAIVQLQFDSDSLFQRHGRCEVYAWRNPQLDDPLGGPRQVHSGFGVSLSQAFTDSLGGFLRAGRRVQGTGNFNRFVTVGVHQTGLPWGRQQDVVGVTMGLLNPSDGYRAVRNVAGNEKNVELFYNWHVNEHMEISPHVQWIGNPAASAAVDHLDLVGVRAAYFF